MRDTQYHSQKRVLLRAGRPCREGGRENILGLQVRNVMFRGGTTAERRLRWFVECTEWDITGVRG